MQITSNAASTTNFYFYYSSSTRLEPVSVRWETNNNIINKKNILKTSVGYSNA